MEEFGGHCEITLGGESVSHVTDVVIYAESFLQHNDGERGAQWRGCDEWSRERGSFGSRALEFVETGSSGHENDTVEELSSRLAPGDWRYDRAKKCDIAYVNNWGSNVRANGVHALVVARSHGVVI